MPAEPAGPYPFASLPANLAAFCGVLRREHGFRAGPRELQDAARAVQLVRIDDERAVRDALRPVLSHRLEDVAAFDEAFDRFFHPRRRTSPAAESAADRSEVVRDRSMDRATPPSGGSRESAFELPEVEGTGAGAAAVAEESDDATGQPAGVVRSAYSPADAEGAPLDLPPVDATWRAAAAAFAARVETRLSRRWKPAPRGRQFDLRRTLRASLHTAGEAVLPRWRARPRVLARFVVIVDGSRSMAAHRQPALHLAVALSDAVPRTEVFVFSTALRNVTRDVQRAAAGERRRLPELQHAWGGGTGIGTCLRELVHRYGWQVLGSEVVVIIASDGLDLGPPETLRQAMAQVKRRSAAIVWLNPLVETAGYEPSAAGMRAALPFVTTLAWAANPDGLVRLAGSLGRIRR